jgi:hypothetical protein
MHSVVARLLNDTQDNPADWDYSGRKRSLAAGGEQPPWLTGDW